MLSKQIFVGTFPASLCAHSMPGLAGWLAVGLLYYVINVGMPPSHPGDKGCRDTGLKDNARVLTRQLKCINVCQVVVTQVTCM